MSTTIAILSMLHEAPGRGSADRLFRGRPVVQWTVDRLSRANGVDRIALLCWDDQRLPQIVTADKHRVSVHAKGSRVSLPEINALAASRRWADGWRGGLLSTCDFDAGFHGNWFHETAKSFNADAVILVDPAAGLVDPHLIDSLIRHALDHGDAEMVFCPSAPGLAGALMRTPLLQRLASGNVHPGRLLHYHPDQLSREPLAGDGCLPIPAPLARTKHRFTLDSDRQIRLLTQALQPLNGDLISSTAEDLLHRVNASATPSNVPREIILELTTRRSTRPLYWPGRFTDIQRDDLPLDAAMRLLDELGTIDDVRLTLAGVGDPVLHERFFEIVALASDRGVRAIQVETDLFHAEADAIARLAQAPIDVISIHLPGLSQDIYERVMGVTGYTTVLENIRALVTQRLVAGRGRVPIVVPTFVKCRQNLAEMEAWYDQWLRAVGSAVIRGPSAFGGIVPLDDLTVADMAPPKRRPCVRTSSRMMVLSDGRIVSCEEDVLGRQMLGRIDDGSIGEVWNTAGKALRQLHEMGKWNQKPICATCAEWHRA